MTDQQVIEAAAARGVEPGVIIAEQIAECVAKMRELLERQEASESCG